MRIDRETLEPRVRVIGTDAWSDDAAFAGTTVTGICGSGIIEVIGEMYLAGIIDTDGFIQGSLSVRSPRIVEDGRTGWLVPPGDPAALARALTAVLEDPAEARRRAAAAGVEVRTRFSWRTIAERTVHLYADTATAASRSGA